MELRFNVDLELSVLRPAHANFNSQIQSQYRQALGDVQQRQAANVPGQSHIERSQATASFRPGFADTERV